MLRRRDVPELVERLRRPIFVRNMAFGLLYDPRYRRGAERRMADAERDVQIIVNEFASGDEARLWELVEHNYRHAMRYPHPTNAAEVRFVDHHVGKVAGLLDAIAILRGGVYATAKMTVDREWADRRTSDGRRRVRDESKLVGLKHGD